MHKQCLVVAVSWLVFGLPAAAADCPVAEPLAQRSLAQDRLAARELVLQAAARLGGLDPIREIQRLSFVAEGAVSNGMQGYDAADIDRPATRRAFRRVTDLDFQRSRHRRASTLAFDGNTLNSTDVYADGRVWSASDTGVFSESDGTETGFVDSSLRYLPALLILRAVDNLSTALGTGPGCVNGVKSVAVDFSWNERTRLRLHLHPMDHRILRLEAVSADPLRGQDSVTYDFVGENAVAGVLFPRRVIYSRRGAVFTDASIIDVEVNPIFEDSSYISPAGYRRLVADGRAREIAPGSYEMALAENANTWVQFFDLGTSVVVFDAPGSAADSRAVAAEVDRVTGGKPISHVIVSHFHEDHAGGVGFYAERDVTIVTTADTAEVLGRYAHAENRLSGAPAATAKPLRFQFVTQAPLVIPGEREVVVYPMPDIPHVKSMLAAFYPSAGVFAEADLYDEFAPVDFNAVAFAQWLRRPEAPRVEYLAGAHHAHLSLADFLARVAAFEDLP